MHKRGLRRQALRFIETPEPKGEGPEDTGGAGGKATDKPEEKTFTQAELTSIAAREKNEGKAAAERSIAEQLGVSIEEAKAIVKAAKDADEAKKSEAEKDREAAAKEKQEAEAERQAAKAEVHEARLERAFAKEGIDLEDGDDKTKRLLRLVTVETGASYEDVLKDVQKIKADFPALFGKSEESTGKTTRKAPSGDPKGNPPKPTAGEDRFEAGKARAQRHRSRFQQKQIAPARGTAPQQ